MVDAPETEAVGSELIVTFEVVLLQLFTDSVNVKETIPEETPVINPVLSIVATPGELLIHVPPPLGLAVIVVPTHNTFEGVLTTGRGFTVTDEVVLLQLVAVSVKVNVTAPADIPVINPALSMVAIPEELLTQVPPVLGLAVIVDPIHREADGVLTTGNAFTVTEEVVLLQPVAVSVKVNVTLPADTPVINPALVMVAIPGALLTHVPPALGPAVIVAPIHKEAEGVLTTGSAFTVMDDVVLLQPVAVSVKVNVTTPADTPIINPAFVMVATPGALLNHVPPALGLAVIVDPIHNEAEGVLTTGSVFTVTDEVVLLQPVAVLVKVNVTAPADTPVTNPAFVMVATPGALLIHVPPALGLAVIVDPIHKVAKGVLTTGSAFTVTDVVVLLQPVAVSVKVNVTTPADTPVITPALSMVATPVELLIHVPPTPGLAVIVDPIHKEGEGVLTTGRALMVTDGVVLLQPVVVSVKVKVTTPAETPVINPAFVTVATPGALLNHVPPALGLAVIVDPIHKEAEGVLTTGSEFTVTDVVVLLQPVAVSVKVNVTDPAETPVINPAFVMVAIPGALLNHVPPALGLAVIVAPIHKEAEGVLTTGSAFTVTEEVVLLQPVAELVNVNVTAPAETPVINPAFVMVATPGALLTHVPPALGLAVIVAPIHKEADGVLTTGNAFTVTEEVVLLQPVAVLVKVNVTAPADTPVINPAFVMVAIPGALLTHVPPTLGLAVIVAPIHTEAEGVLTRGSAFTVTEEVVLLQPVAVLVKVNVTDPAETPVINPAFVMVATPGALLTHVPPAPGLAVIVNPIHKDAEGVLTTGNALIVTDEVVLLHPVAVLVKVNVTAPAETPVINPAFVMVATPGALLIHVPPALGLAVIVAPIHKEAEGVLTTGSAFTVTDGVVLLQPVAVSVKVNVTTPADTPVINPAFVIVATPGVLLTHVPPALGLAVIVAPIHKEAEGVLTTGSALIVTDGVVLLQPPAAVKVNVTAPTETPVINPAFVMVATPGALLIHVPPALGLAVIVVPMHKEAEGVLTTGNAFTVTDGVVLLQPVAVLVKVNVTDPAETPVINPAFVMVATPGALLTQVPPTLGLAVIVAPIHNEAEGVLTTGSAFTTTSICALGPSHPITV